MKHATMLKKIWATSLLAMALLLFGQSAYAWDAAYSRRGPFVGVGFDGGAAIFSEGEATGTGALGTNFQLGIGASDNFTVSLNLDMQLHIGNDIKQGLIVPGPQFAIFITKNFYLSAGVGLAIAISTEPFNDNNVGMDMGMNVGYEHFINTNIAAYVSGGVDYYLLNDALDVVVIMMGLGIRYY